MKKRIALVFLVFIGLGVIALRWATSDQLETRMYKIDTKVLARNLQDFQPAKKAQTSQEKLIIFFQHHEAGTAAPMKLSIDEKIGALIVRTTPANFEKVEELLTKMHNW